MKPEDANWRYDALPHTGRCEIDGQAIGLAITLYGDESHGLDVLRVEQRIGAVLAKHSTVEGIANDVAEMFGKHSVQVSGQTDTHGTITVRITR